ncbi:CatB-related O-acetyltransferase [Aliivibrio kagoshimensis]|uniref:CatB-related O-acetyltransferase n=1 Tax=Aliivibrio kagoshimensis TaxID=2910230 RepID=UPI003D0C63D2
MKNEFNKIDLFLLNICGKYISKREHGERIFHPIKSIAYFALIYLRGHKKDDLHRYISSKFCGFSVGKSTIGYKAFWSVRMNGAKLLKSVGSFSSIAPHVVIVAGNHPIHFKSTSSILYSKNRGFIPESKQIPEQLSDVIIGNDVWIGSNVTILPGVNIADGSIVAAGSVVNRDVPPYAIVAGVPAKVIKYRFDSNTINQLLEEKWWNWSDEKIKEKISTMYNESDFFN